MIDEMEPFAASVTKAWRRGRRVGFLEGLLLGLIAAAVALVLLL